jgi:hypothetical protein
MTAGMALLRSDDPKIAGFSSHPFRCDSSGRGLVANYNHQGTSRERGADPSIGDASIDCRSLKTDIAMPTSQTDG